MFRAESITDLSVDLEIRVRLTLRGLVWDFVGEDYGQRASWILMTLEQLVGNNARKQAIFFLAIFGSGCEDGNHWDTPAELTCTQRHSDTN